MRTKKEYDKTSNNSVWKKCHKELKARCSRCPWHGVENASNYGKHGRRKLNKRRYR